MKTQSFDDWPIEIRCKLLAWLFPFQFIEDAITGKVYGPACCLNAGEVIVFRFKEYPIEEMGAVESLLSARNQGLVLSTKFTPS